MSLAGTVRGWRRWLDGWFEQRSPRSDSLQLTHRNVYIVPTRAGLLFCFTLAVLLVASINYQLNLGYVLTFLLAGSGVVSMHMTHGTLRGLTLHLRPVHPVFAGDTATLEAVLSSAHRPRYGMGLRLRSGDTSTLGHTDVPGGGQSVLRIGFVPGRRGRQPLPTLCVETRFPLGLFRAWAVWHPAMSVLVYPRPERPASALPASRAVSGGPLLARSPSGFEFEGVRAYRRGDPLKSIAWKQAAKTLASGGGLVSRDHHAHRQQQLWLDWQACGHLDAEARLSRLAAWIVEADRRDAAWGLSLPRCELPMDQGSAHRQRGLEALALWTA
jgi:uncharacterized protein (DUF58 family)